MMNYWDGSSGFMAGDHFKHRPMSGDVETRLRNGDRRILTAVVDGHG